MSFAENMKKNLDVLQKFVDAGKYGKLTKTQLKQAQKQVQGLMDDIAPLAKKKPVRKGNVSNKTTLAAPAQPNVQHIQQEQVEKRVDVIDRLDAAQHEFSRNYDGWTLTKSIPHASNTGKQIMSFERKAGAKNPFMGGNR